MISSDSIRGYNDIIILSLLIDAPSYGYEISKKIRKITEDQYVIKETTLYSAFSRLEKAGYLHSFEGEVTKGKSRIYYQVNEKGLDYYKNKCNEYNLTKRVVDMFIREE